MPGFVLGVRLVLAAVFAVAGVAKLLDAAGSRGALEGFGVPRGAARLAGRVLPVAELAIAAGLLVPASAWWSALAAAGLLAVFMAAIGVSMARGAAPDCHCFGRLHSAPVSWRTQVRNGVLAAAGGVAVLAGRGASGLSPVRWAGHLTPRSSGSPPPSWCCARPQRGKAGSYTGFPGRTAGSWPAWTIWSSGSAPAARLRPRGWRVCGMPAVRAPSGVLPSVCRPRNSSCLPTAGSASRCGRFSAGDCRYCSSSQFPGAVTATHCSRRWPAGSTSIATASRWRSQPGDLPGRRPPRRRHPGCVMCLCKPTAKSPRPTRQTAPRAQC